MENTNKVSRSDTGMHDMNEALAEFFTELDVLDELKSGVAQKERAKRISKSNRVIINTAMRLELAAGKLKKLATYKRRKKASFTSMFQIH